MELELDIYYRTSKAKLAWLYNADSFSMLRAAGEEPNLLCDVDKIIVCL